MGTPVILDIDTIIEQSYGSTDIYYNGSTEPSSFELEGTTVGGSQYRKAKIYINANKFVVRIPVNTKIL